MPVGLGRQNNCRADRKAEYRQLGCVTQIAPSTRYAVVGVGGAYTANKE